MHLTMQSAAKLWALTMAVCLLAAFAFLPRSYMSDAFLMLWAMTAVVVFYRARHQKPAVMHGNSKAAAVLLGLFSAFLSFEGIPMGLGKAPYSLDDFTLLLAGASVAAFALLGMRPLLLPAMIPFAVVLGYQLVGASPSHMDVLMAPTIAVLAAILPLVGINPVVNGNLFTFLTADGARMRVSIVPDCTGIWSLIAYSVAVAMIVIVLPRIKRKGYVLFALGFPITYAMNITRVVLIFLAIHRFGPGWAPQMAHANLGWMVFSAWMLVFWYAFFKMRPYGDEAEGAAKT